MKYINSYKRHKNHNFPVNNKQAKRKGETTPRQRLVYMNAHVPTHIRTPGMPDINMPNPARPQTTKFGLKMSTLAILYPILCITGLTIFVINMQIRQI